MFDSEEDIDIEEKRKILSANEAFLRHLENKVKFRRYDVMSGMIDGSSQKGMIRVDDSIAGLDSCHASRTIQDSRYFGELISELNNNPNCTYMTHNRDLILSGINPRFFSCIAKDNSIKTESHGIKDFNNRAEIAGSRLANLLGVPTVFIRGVEEDGTIDSILSVDFIPYGYDYEDFLGLSNDNLSTCVNDDSSMNKWVKSLKKSLATAYPDGVNEECLDMLINRTLPLTMLFRKGLFKDADLQSFNMGVLRKQDSDEFYLAPNYDMECLFSRARTSAEYFMPDRGCIRDVVEYCARVCPDILQGFVSRVETAVADGSIEEILNSCFKGKDKKTIFSNMLTSFSEMQRFTNKYLPSRER